MRLAPVVLVAGAHRGGGHEVAAGGQRVPRGDCAAAPGARPTARPRVRPLKKSLPVRHASPRTLHRGGHRAWIFEPTRRTLVPRISLVTVQETPGRVSGHDRAVRSVFCGVCSLQAERQRSALGPSYGQLG